MSDKKENKSLKGKFNYKDFSDLYVARLPRNLTPVQAEAAAEKFVKADLVKAIEPHMYLPKKDISYFVDIIFYKIMEAALAGKSVWIDGFGTFSMYEKGYTHGYNPYYQKYLTVPPRKFFRFRPARCVRQFLNEHTECGNPRWCRDTKMFDTIEEVKKKIEQLNSDPIGENFEVVN